MSGPDAPAQPRTAPSRAAIAAVLAIVAAVFGRALWGGFVYDDLSLIANNPGLHDPSDVAGLWSRPLWGEQLGHWRPLTAQLLALGWWLGHGTPWAIHAQALLLHLLATFAVLQLWRELGGAPRGAIVAASLFALHPAQAESVAWCSGLNDVLWGCCALHGLWCFRRWRRTQHRRDLAFAMLFAAAAMAAKETGITVPFLYLGSDLLLGRARASLRVHAWSLLLLLGYWLARTVVFGEASAGLSRTTFAPLGNAWWHGAAVTTGLAARLTWPVGRDMFDDIAHLGAADVLAAVALAAFAMSRCWRGHRRALLATLCIAASLLPPAFAVQSLGPYPLADRYLYVSCAGFALLLAGDHTRWSLAWRAVLAMGFAIITLVQVGDFADEPTFVAHALTRHPDDPRLHYMQARPLLERAGAGDADALPRAWQSLRRADQLLGFGDAVDDPLRLLRSDVRTGLAWCQLFEEGRKPRPDWASIEQHFQQVTDRWPDRADAFVGLGIARASANRFEPAEVAFRRALELDPATSAAHHNLGRLLLQRGDRASARIHLQEALRLSPHDDAARQLIEALDAAPRQVR